MGEQVRFQWLKEALDFFDHGDHWSCPRWTIVLVSFLILLLVSVTMLAIGDALNAKGAVLTRYLARAQAPLTAQWGYPATARDDITVVLYDQEFLDGSGSAWPITYGQHADNLLRLAGEENQRPYVIFLDITFGQERDDPSVAQLAKALCKLKDKHIKVFLAGLPTGPKGQLQVRKGLQEADKEPCFELVGVDYFPDPLDGLAWTYELSRHWAGDRMASGPQPVKGEPVYPSAALAIANAWPSQKLGTEEGRMALVWGHNSASQDAYPRSLAGCRRGERELSQVIPKLLRSLFGEEARTPLCPYHRTLSADQLNYMDASELSRHVSRKFVLVGANVPGYNDFVQSPVHGLLPGVHVHAMALDNFRTFGDGYKVDVEWSDPLHRILVGPALMGVAAVFLVHLLWNLMRRRVAAFFAHAAAFEDFRRGSARYNASPWWVRWGAARVVRALGWAFRLTLQTIAAMILIALLQKVFRIGMLPVAELVGMTLVAEGLGLVRVVRDFLFEPRPAPAPVAPSV